MDNFYDSEESLEISTPRYNKNKKDLPDIITSSGSLTNREYKLMENHKEDEFNIYASIKSVGQQFLTTSVLQAQIGMFIGMFEEKLFSEFSGFQYSLFALIIFSVCLQVTIFILIVILLKTKKLKDRRRSCSTEKINIIATALTGVSLIINITITILSRTIGVNSPDVNINATQSSKYFVN